MAASAPTGTYLVEAGWILGVVDGRPQLIEAGSMLIEGDRVAAGGPERHPPSVPRVSLPDHLVLPGLISGHTHVASATPTRGIIEGGRSYSRPIKLVDRLSDDDLDALTAFNLAEILKAGCTTQVEMSLSLRQAESSARVAGPGGARGYVGGRIPGA